MCSVACCYGRSFDIFNPRGRVLMCGIVGYIGPRQAYPIVKKGLERLEYRGYDSAGIAVLNNDDLYVYKCRGKVSDLEDYIAGKPVDGYICIGHTRWATHGVADSRNAHPHRSGNMVIVHNGVIENYETIKEELRERHKFLSDTDTEVLIHLIKDIQVNERVTLQEAVRLALNEVVGAYAIIILSKDNPDELIVAKKGSPLVIGIGEGEFFVASDATPIVEYTKNVVYLEDGDIASISLDNGLKIKTIKNCPKTPYIERLEMNLELIEKGNHEHYMIKEIYEQPRSIASAMSGRLHAKNGIVNLGGIAEYERKFLTAKRVIFIGCGTSWHAGLVGERLFEDLVRIPAEVEYASEFRYHNHGNPVIYEDDVVVAISQSGETKDTLEAIKLAESKGATIIGICNVVGSSIARKVHAGSYTHAGPEIGVASTKAFTSQVTILILMALQIAYRKGTIARSRFFRLITELESIPEKVKKVLALNDKVKYIASKHKNASNAIYLGKDYHFPVALEGALKLTEVSYIHAQGFPAAEMKHGPIALVDGKMPVIVLATKNGSYDKVLTNIEEIKARRGEVIAIITEGDMAIREKADDVIEIPEVDEILAPLLAVIPLQLFAYHIALMRGCNVDQPRNLAKSVTVE